MSHEAPLLVHLAYLAAAICFIVGLKFLSSPATARRGNQIAMVGMALAVGTTLFLPGLKNMGLILAAMLIGGGIAAWLARVVKMTDMPQVVAMLNGLGGGAACLVSSSELLHAGRFMEPLTGTESVSSVLGGLIGGLSFSGSMIAFGKLQGLVSEKPLVFPGQRVVNSGLQLGMVALAVAVGFNHAPALLFTFLGFVMFSGVMLVMPIGGADMPVVISLLNSFTGLAAAATGFVLSNNALIISGTLVGASGTILTQLMCKAMNRSLANVLFSAFGATTQAPGSAAAAGGKPASVRDVTPEDAAVLLANVQSLIVVPGYGMAVAQAQHVVREMCDLLGAHGVSVKYAIHPVAGRMPGHMNVLLAEANVPYDQLFDIDAINPEFEHTDVALVIGANDVVNPAARSDKTSPIYGMPILDVDKAKHIIIVKRSLNPGFAGIDNPIYYDPKTMMLFADAKNGIQKVVEELKHQY
jgi:NAD(P) transhydrogenase subunit beta